MPKYLGLLQASEESENEAAPDPELMARMGPFIEEAVNAGVLLATDGLKASKHGKRVVSENGEVRIIDGPFTESKELVASYALMECKDMDECIQWVRRFMDIIGTGTCEIRPIFEFDDFPADIFPPEEVAREAVWRETMARNAEKAQ